ncbi:hypothetical protein [Tropicimonas sp. IMCC6043]|uniref:hypothetical protein n=1 Tax=Tropicimonas sp. IMCC6043 TaxID=2510645 RepID=UPI00101C021D|nr:hypothetical protein [Tropicimonas sp. IMCC6043]RYH07170.1 hypothetical protein EU800_21105 [Tropicimonas sp. IMCC6043]
MTRLFNLFCIGVLAAFLLGSVGQAASIGGMAVGMDALHSVTPAGCDDCDGADDDAGCVGDCVSLTVAVLPSLEMEADVEKVTEPAACLAAMPGRSDPPATSPPRSHFPI